MNPSQRLSPLDASFLYLERPEAPMHIGAVAVFDGDLDASFFAQQMESRSRTLPRLRHKLHAAPFGSTQPSWEHDPRFDIRRHVISRRVEGEGTEADLSDCAGSVLTGMLDRDKPLWELYVLRGLQGGRSAVVSKIHHALVDGVGANEIVTTIFDRSCDGSQELEANSAQKPLDEAPCAPPRVLDALRDGVVTAIDAWTGAMTSSLDLLDGSLPGRRRQGLFAGLQNFQSAYAHALAPAERLPFNRQCGARRRLVWSSLSFDDARQVRARLGGTFNDLILTLLGGAIGEYARAHGQETVDRFMKVMVPVNLRRFTRSGELGNRVSFLPLQVPLGIDDPKRRLCFIHTTTQQMKRSSTAEILAAGSQLLGAIPAGLQQLAGLMPTPSMALFNMVCTNVPGPQVPLWSQGHRLVEYYPYVPVGYGQGLGCAVFSHEQRLFLGFTSDDEACPDVERIPGLIEQAKTELLRSAGLPEAGDQERITVELDNTARSRASSPRAASPRRETSRARTETKRAPTPSANAPAVAPAPH